MAPTQSALNMALGQIITNTVRDPRALDAMVAVPRENFVPPALRGASYADAGLDVGYGRFLIEPMVLARLLAEGNITPDNNVLVIGAAPGYIAAVAAQLAARVLGTENSEELADFANANLQSLGLWHAKVVTVKSLTQGYADEGKFDAIILGGAVEEIPPALGEQLAEGGVILGVRNITQPQVGTHGLGKAFAARKYAGVLRMAELFDASIGALPDFRKKVTFIF